MPAPARGEWPWYRLRGAAGGPAPSGIAPPTLCAPMSILLCRAAVSPGTSRGTSSFLCRSSLRFLGCQGLCFSRGPRNTGPAGFQHSAPNRKQISPAVWEKTTDLRRDCISCQKKACLLQKPLIPPRLRVFCRGSQQTWLLLLLKSLNLVYGEGRGGGERTGSEAPRLPAPAPHLAAGG